MKTKCTKISLLQLQHKHKHQHRETSSMYQGSSNPSMIIEIEKDQDVAIEVDNPYPQIGVEVVSKGTTVSTRHVLSTYGVCHSVPAVSRNVQTSVRIHGI